jgi:hypothetical protein
MTSQNAMSNAWDFQTDAMKALQRGFCVNCEQNPKHMEVLQQYGTVYRM